jgi:hypothetical protein
MDRQEFLETVEKDKFRELIATLGDHPYEFETLFHKTKGLGVGSYLKNKVRLIKLLEPTFEKILFPQEKILFVTRGVLNSFAEQYFMGIISMMLNHTAFIFTNHRIILYNISTKGKPQEMKWHIPYHQIKTFKATSLFSGTKFVLEDGKKMSFVKIHKLDRKKLKEMVQVAIDDDKGRDQQMPHFVSKDNLCTACYWPVRPKTYKCEKCDEEFVQPMKPALMSLAFPSLGDFYMGHTMVALLETVGYLFTWFYILVVATAGLGSAGFMMAGGILFVAHVFDFGITLHIAKKGLMSTKAAWTGRSSGNASGGKMIAMVVILASIAGIIAIGLSDITLDESVSEQVVPADRVIVSMDGMYSAKLPDHWNILLDLDDEAGLQFGDNFNGDYMTFQAYEKADDESSMEEYMTENADFLKDFYKGSKTSNNKIEVNGQQALQTTIRGSFESINIYYLFTVIETETHFIEIDAWTINDEKSVFRDFQKVISSFKVVGE